MARTVLQADFDFIREVFPVTKAVAYGNNCYQLIRTAKIKTMAKTPERGKIVSISRKSLLRLMFTMQCTSATFGSMLTLTYPKYYPDDGAIVKADINVVLQKIRRLGWSYVWFLEFQKRGAPHIHILLSPKVVTPTGRAIFGLFWTERIAVSKWFRDICPEDEYLSQVLKMARFNCHETTLQVLREEQGGRNYATKYAAKERQKKVPAKYRNVGRFWGMSKDVRPEGIEFDVTEEEIEQWLVENRHPASEYCLVPRYIWGLGSLSVRDQGSTTSVATALDG